MERLNFTPEGRYDRQERIEWWDQARLARARILVVGAGALGNEVLKLLALLGVGHVTVVDFDTVARSNLARMVLFREADVGRPKVEVVAERVRELNPDVAVLAVAGDLRLALGLGEYRRHDLVLGCLDSVNARWSLNRRCQRAGVAWIDGGISHFHGQVARYEPGQGACYECNFTPATYERFNRRYACPFGLVAGPSEPRVPTTAVTTSATAALQVQEALLRLHGRPAEALAPGERLTLYLQPYALVRDRLARNPDCLAHDPLPAEVPALDLGPAALTAARLLALAAEQGTLPTGAEVELPFELVASFTCPACGFYERVLQPKEAVRHAQATCPRCGALRPPELVTTIGQGSPLADVPLAALGVPAREVVSIVSQEDRRYFELGPA